MKNVVIKSDTELLPEIWIMSIVVAALDTWTISRVADGTTRRVLAQVFENMRGGGLGPGCYTDDNGTRAKQLAADIGFWRVHAQDRGLDAGMASAIKSWQSSSTYDFSFVTQADSSNNRLKKLFTWLLGPKSHLDLTLLVTNINVYKVAKLLRVVGIRIKINSVSLPTIEQNPLELLVYLAEISSSNYLLTIKDSTKTTIATGFVALLVCLIN
jgi:hypothetical protein